MSRNGDVYVLLVGINDYECSAVRSLNFAVADVLAFQQLMNQRMNLDLDNHVLLAAASEYTANPAGRTPSRREILRALSQFASAPMGPYDTFVFYFAGHGFSVENKTYLLAVDSDPGSAHLLEDTAISVDRLTSYLRDIKAGQQLLVLDACRNEPAGATRSTSTSMDSTMARDITTLVRRETQAGQTTRQSRAILSACWEGQASYEYEAAQHSWFCHNLLECLQQHTCDEIEVTELTELLGRRMQENAWRSFPEAAGQQPHLELVGRPVRISVRPSDETWHEATLEQRQTLADVLPIRLRAQTAWEDIAKFENEASLRESYKETELLWRHAESLFDRTLYDESELAFRELIARSEAIRELRRENIARDVESDVDQMIESRTRPPARVQPIGIRSRWGANRPVVVSAEP